MPKRILLAVIGFLLLSVTIPAFAQENGFSEPPTIEELTRLTQFYPADIDMLFVSRIDYPFIRDIDSFINALVAHADISVDTGLLEQLNELSADYPGGDLGGFAETFGWLGDTMAFGVVDFSPLFDDKYNNDERAPLLIAVEINNREGADRFGQEVANESGNYAIESTEAYDIYMPHERNRGYPYLLINDDAIFMSNNLSLLPRQPVENSWFAENADSIAERLPLPAYHALLESNTARILDAMNSGMYYGSLFDGSTFGTSILMGFASEGAHTYFIDTHQMIDFDLSIYDALAQPIDEAFLQYIPRDTTFVGQSPNFSAYVNNFVSALASPEISQFGGGIDVDEINEALRGIAGADLDELFGWMEGNYAYTVDVSPTLRNASSLESALESFPVEFAFITQVTPENEANAQATVDSIHRALTFLASSNRDLTVRQTTLGDIEVSEVRYVEGRDDPPLLVYVGTGNGVFVIGTGNPARFALNVDEGEDFTASALYSTTREYGIENSIQTIHITSPHLYEVFDTFGYFLPESFSAILYLFGDISMTSAYTQDNAAIARIVLVTPQE